MQESSYRKNILELSDGEYSGVLKRVFRNDLKDRDMFFINLIINVNGEEYSYGHYCSEKSINYLFSDILMPLGMYASEKGISDSLKLKDIFIKFTKTSSEKYASLKIQPIYEYKNEAPVGSKNFCLDSENIETNNNSNDTEQYKEDSFMDEIPY